MTDTAVIVKGEERDPALALDRVIIAGDLSKLTPTDRVTYYRTVCDSIGLNPFTRPFEYIVLNGRLTLYAGKSCTDQLRSLRSISIDSAERDPSDPDYATWVVAGHDATGRTDMEIGSVHIAGLKGEARANAIMKALTKGKRRLTLSLAGLGWLDETEVGSVPSAQDVDVDQDTGEIRRLPLREQVAQRRHAIGDGSEVAPPSSEPHRPDEPGMVEPPLSDEYAGARTVTPGTGARTGRSRASTPATHDGEVLPARTASPSPDAVALPTVSDAADGSPPGPSAPLPVCGAVPPEGPLGMSWPCILRGQHVAHRSSEGSWPL